MMCIFVIVTIMVVACHNESDPTPADEGIEYPIPDDAEVIVDAAGLSKTFMNNKILTTTDGDSRILIGIRARSFYLPRDIKNHQVYYNLIITNRILKFTIGTPTSKGNPIIKVEIPDEKSKEFLEAKDRLDRLDNVDAIDTKVETRSTTSLSNVIPNTSAMNTAFNYLKSQSCHLIQMCPCIPFQYAVDGCYARAHLMRKFLADNYGYNCWKIFVVGDLEANTQPPSSCCQHWEWHVAPVVRVGTSTSYTEYVLDPGLFSSPVSISTWLNKLTGSNCASGYIDDYVVVSGENYGINYLGNLTTDTNYTNTYATMNDYANLSGCN
jgi:hypothetical protein